MKNTTGWVLLLPFLEQRPLFDKYNCNVCSSMSDQNSVGVLGTDTINEAVIQTRVSAFECPSAPTAGELRLECRRDQRPLQHAERPADQLLLRDRRVQ